MDKFDLNLIPAGEVPALADAVALAKEIFAEAPTWPRNRASTDDLQVYSTTRDGEPWFARVADVDVPFDYFKQAFVPNFFESMVEFYEYVNAQKPIDDAGEWKGYELHYILPGYFADRNITEWFGYTCDDDAREFYIFALPADLPLAEGATRAVYVFFHHVREDPETKQVCWSMAQTSDMRGNLPRWMQNMSIPGIFVSDVPKFCNYLRKKFGDGTDLDAEDGPTTDDVLEQVLAAESEAEPPKQAGRFWGLW
ncbi:uncharacterized protein V1510DRAFT_413584 [Dipodascopsis tothii]|uniref:uncharacterized protein n=1 Tax=Dipodascopsis tothii TaxID=44089 RepID=UPI0034D01A47